MATEILIPTAPGTDTEFTGQYPNSDAHWDKVLTSDGDSSYVYSTSATYQRDLYNLSNPSVSGIINFIVVELRIRRSAGTSVAFKYSLRSDSVTTDYFEQNIGLTWLTLPEAPYDEGTEKWSVNPANSQPWTWADMETLQAGLSMKTNGQGRCTRVRVLIDYEPSRGYTQGHIIG